MRFDEVDIQESPTEEEWYGIAVFKERTAEALSTLWGLRLRKLVGHYSRMPDGSFRGSMSLPSDANLQDLYVKFRHLYGQREPGGFGRVLGIIARRSKDPRVRAFAKHLRSQFRSEMVESGFFRVDGHRLSGSRLVDTWFNARVFHSDRGKRLELDRLTRLFGQEGFRSLLFLTVYDALLASRNLAFVLKDFKPGNLRILVPERFAAPEVNSAIRRSERVDPATAVNQRIPLRARDGTSAAGSSADGAKPDGGTSI